MTSTIHTLCNIVTSFLVHSIQKDTTKMVLGFLIRIINLYSIKFLTM